MAFTISEPSPTDVGTSRSAFGVGQVLDFEEGDAPDLTIPSTEKIESRHNLNVLDFSSMGLSAEEIVSFNEQVEKKVLKLEREYEIKRSALDDNQTAIKENQKSINESSQAIYAAELVGDEDILSKLNNHRDELLVERDRLVNEHEIIVAQTEQLKDEIRQLNSLVR